MADDLVLHGSRIWTSPYVFSVFVALKKKGIPRAVFQRPSVREWLSHTRWRDR